MKGAAGNLDLGLILTIYQAFHRFFALQAAASCALLSVHGSPWSLSDADRCLQSGVVPNSRDEGLADPAQSAVTLNGKMLHGWHTLKPTFKPTFKVQRKPSLEYITKRAATSKSFGTISHVFLTYFSSPIPPHAPCNVLHDLCYRVLIRAEWCYLVLIGADWC